MNGLYNNSLYINNRNRKKTLIIDFDDSDNTHLGSGTEWCTATGKDDGYFLDYIKQGPLYVIINKNNPKEKYQFSYESNQFMDAEDSEIFINY